MLLVAILGGVPMIISMMPRTLAAAMVGLGVFVFGLTTLPSVRGGTRHPDPAQVVPLELIAPDLRESVADVISSSTFHREGAPDTFPCHPKIYMSLLDEPALTLALWQDLVTSPVTLRQVGPDLYQGNDGSGTTATGQFVYRSPKLHVILATFECLSPHGNIRLTGRIVLIVHSHFFMKDQAENWVKHDVDAYVKIDSRGWRAVAKTVRPLIEKYVEDEVQEAGWFVSLMGRLVEMYPNWASQVALQAPEVRPDVRQSFRLLLTQARRPGAFTGRPVLAENADTAKVR
jgi:hypothetical protein